MHESIKLLRKNFIIITIMIVILIIASNVALYSFLTKDYNKKFNTLDDSLNLMENNLGLKINMLEMNISDVRIESENKRKLLKDQTNENLQDLTDYINQKTSSLQLNLESQLSNVEDVMGDLEERSTDLEDKISEIRVKSDDFSSIIEDVIKAVVSIQTNSGQGSGVIFNEDGYILTNKHVIEGASAISVIDYDSNSYPVRIIGLAESVDLAVIQISSNQTFDSLRFEDDVNVGERVIAVGNPLGLSFTVTEGIVSAINREIDDTGVGYIQTDVSINPGNSGGPLINSRSRIVGINTFKISASEGLGFAIPAIIAEDIASQAFE